MNLKQLNESLDLYIRPQTFPLALKLCQSESDLPEKVRMPMRDLGYQVTLCQAIGLSRRYRWALAVGKGDQCCLGGALVMGFIAEPPQGAMLTAPAEKKLEAGKFRYLLISPIQTADFEPDLVVVYCEPAQANRLVQSAGGIPGVGVSASASGGLDCGDVVSRTINSDECQFVLPSGGDLIFAGTQNHEVVFTMPRSKVERVIKGLEDTHKLGFRYPVLTDLRHQPALPPFLEIPKSA